MSARRRFWANVLTVAALTLLANAFGVAPEMWTAAWWVYAIGILMVGQVVGILASPRREQG